MEVTQEQQLFYSNSLEYLFDECRRIELLLHISLQKHLKKNHAENGNFQNLFISDEEIQRIVQEPFKRTHEQSPETEGLKEQYHRLVKEIEEKRNNTIARKQFLSLFVLQNIFNLSPFELDVLVLCLLPDVHKKYERILGYLQDDITQKRPTIGFISDVFSSSLESRMQVFRYFFEKTHLFKYEILKQAMVRDNDQGISSRALKVDERIIHYLFEVNGPDPLLAPFATLKMPEVEMNNGRLDTVEKEGLQGIIKRYLKAKGERRKLFINLSGNDEGGKRFTAGALCREAGLALLIVDLAEVMKTQSPIDTLLKTIFREGILQPAAIYFEGIEHLSSEDDKSQTFKKTFFKIANELSWITFFGGAYNQLAKESTLNQNIFINSVHHAPDSYARRDIWKDVLDKESINVTDTDLHSLASKFRFTGGQIVDAVSSTKNIAWPKNGSSGNITIESLYEGCRLQSNHKLSAMAQRVTSNYTWGDIILTAERLAYLKEISNYIKYKDVVYDRWGFNKKLFLGKGLNILFSGPSGTGKTMAAGVIASDLGLELYKIDLSFVVSKYIGETEKNLSKVFKDAETSNAILFFDEADALFGKRSEIKDAHDRYANIEVNYLLQKMEEHEGMVIMATNLSKNIDMAFLRRMQFVVEFPFPDEREREHIWRGVFPESAPMASDIDYRFLSDRLKITGGTIKNIALNSAFYAAKESSAIGMSHVMLAAKREFVKTGKSFLKSDLDPYYCLTEGK